MRVETEFPDMPEVIVSAETSSSALSFKQQMCLSTQAKYEERRLLPDRAALVPGGTGWTKSGEVIDGHEFHLLFQSVASSVTPTTIFIP